MSAFDSFQRASFAGIEFPWEERTVKLAIREHQHKYPHTAGAALETLGRELYVVDFKCVFSDTFRKYPDIYPSALARLRRLAETETRDDLVIPGIGTIKAVLIGLTQTANPKHMVSGEHVDFNFLEDIEDAFLINSLIGVTSQSLNSAVDAYNLEVNKVRADFAKEPHAGLFDSITNAVNSVLAIVDTAESFGNLLESKILQAANLIYQADRRVRLLNDPVNYTLLAAMLQVWDALRKLFDDIQDTGGKLTIFVLERPMSVLELSKAIYNGDGTKASQLLQLNAFPDPFLIQNGTQVRYYPVTV